MAKKKLQKDKEFVFNDLHFEINESEHTLYEELAEDESFKNTDDFKCDSKKQNVKKNDSKNIHDGHRKRMYKRFMETGLKGFSEVEILEMILYNAFPRGDTNPIAHRLLDAFTNIKNVLNADVRDLVKIEGISDGTATKIAFFKELTDYLNTVHYDPVMLLNSQDIGNFCIEKFGKNTIECFYVISLDAKRQIKAINTISRGDEYETSAPIKEIVRYAYMNDAKYVILCHNHISNNINPSSNDINITNRICALMDTMEIPVIDHIICNSSSYSSFAERGLFLPNYGQMY